MSAVDLNLLTALEALLAEGSVAGAARRLGVSSSAMSRTLTRLRVATGDQLLVRAGQKLVSTPHAEHLRERVRAVSAQATALLQPAGAALNVSALERTFAIRANDGFVEAFGARLLTTVRNSAPGVGLRFVPKSDKDARPLREGLLDLEIGVLGDAGPELRVQALFRDTFVGVVRSGHPLLVAAEITAERYAACAHVIASRRGRVNGPVDQVLASLGLRRAIAAIVPSFAAALSIAAASDLVALVTASYFDSVHGSHLGPGAGKRLLSFPLPFQTDPITVSLLWHPRLDADPSHRWLRKQVAAVCRR